MPVIDKERLQEKIDGWNAAHPVGTRVNAEEQDGSKITRTPAMLLFDQKAVVYLEGHNGYFDLDDVSPIGAAGDAAAKTERAKTGVCYMFPGQGSQQKGMGESLFDSFPDQTRLADSVLGYSIKDLCLEDRNDVLNQTQYTQPALYVVNALTYLQDRRNGEPDPEYVLGHSLGEYSALYAAGYFDFETGLKLVRRRGALMAEAEGGGMAAVIGLAPEAVIDVLRNQGLDRIDAANFNTPSQTVVAGPKQEILDAQATFEAAGARMYIPLKVSGAFHSRYMKDFRDRFSAYLDEFEFSPPSLPVISNVEAEPYDLDRVKELLCNQLTSPVQWTKSIVYLLDRGIETFRECGPGNVQTGLVRKIRKEIQHQGA